MEYNAARGLVSRDIADYLIVDPATDVSSSPPLSSPIRLGGSKKDFMIEKQLARHFVKYSKFLSNLILVFLETFRNS